MMQSASQEQKKQKTSRLSPEVRSSLLADNAEIKNDSSIGSADVIGVDIPESSLSILHQGENFSVSATGFSGDSSFSGGHIEHFAVTGLMVRKSGGEEKVDSRKRSHFASNDGDNQEDSAVTPARVSRKKERHVHSSAVSASVSGNLTTGPVSSYGAVHTVNNYTFVLPRQDSAGSDELASEIDSPAQTSKKLMINLEAAQVQLCNEYTGGRKEDEALSTLRENRVISLTGGAGAGKAELAKFLRSAVIGNNNSIGKWIDLSLSSDPLRDALNHLIEFGELTFSILRERVGESYDCAQENNDGNSNYWGMYNSRLKRDSSNVAVFVFIKLNIDSEQYKKFLKLCRLHLNSAYFIFTTEQRNPGLTEEISLDGNLSINFIRKYFEKNMADIHLSDEQMAELSVVCGSSIAVLSEIAHHLQSEGSESFRDILSSPRDSVSYHHWNNFLKERPGKAEYSKILAYISLLCPCLVEKKIIDILMGCNVRSKLTVLAEQHIITYQNGIIKVNRPSALSWVEKVQPREEYSFLVNFYISKLPNDYLEANCNRSKEELEIVKIYHDFLRHLIKNHSKFHDAIHSYFFYIYYKQGICYNYFFSKYKDGCDSYSLAVSRVSSDLDPVLISKVYGLYADCLYRQGNLNDAITYMNRAISLIDETNRECEANKISGFNLHALGNIYYNNGMYGLANECFEKSKLKRARAHPTDPENIEFGLLSHDIANLYICMAKYRDAGYCFDRAIESKKNHYIAHGDENNSNLALSYERYSELLFYLCKFDDAEKNIDQALKIYTQAYISLDFHIDLIRCGALKIKIIFRKKNDVESSIRDLLSLIQDVFMKFGTYAHRKIVQVHFDLVAIYRSSNDIRSSQEYLTSIDRAQREIGKLTPSYLRHPDRAYYLEQMAFFYIQKKNIERARENIEAAKRIKEEYYNTERENVSLILSTLYIGILLSLEKNYKEAIKIFTVAIERYKSIYGGNIHHPNIAICYHEIGVNERLHALKTRKTQKKAELLVSSERNLSLALSIYVTLYEEQFNVGYMSATLVEYFVTMLLLLKSREIEESVIYQKFEEYRCYDFLPTEDSSISSEEQNFIERIFCDFGSQDKTSNEIANTISSFYTQSRQKAILFFKFNHEERGDIPFIDDAIIHYP